MSRRAICLRGGSGGRAGLAARRPRTAIRPGRLAAGIAAAALALTPLGAGANPPEEREADLSPEAVVDAFHAALEAGELGRALSLLSPQLVVFEDGRAEASRGEYASHHARDDMDFARSTERTILRRWQRVDRSQAWVISWVAVKGSFRGRPVDRNLMESILLLRDGSTWRIVHIHWSSAG